MTVNVLLSYAYHAKTDVAKTKDGIHCGRIMIDSGAFTAHSVGRKIHLDEYAEFLETWQDSYDHAVTLDVIGDPDASKVNTKKLHDRGIPVMPVFTRGESIKEFDAMVKDVGYVCVGGGVGMSIKQVTKRAALLQRRAEELGGGIHALGIGSTRMLRAVRPYSADASTMGSSLAYGKIHVFDGINLEGVLVRDAHDLRKRQFELTDVGFDLEYFYQHGRVPLGSQNRLRILERTLVSGAITAEQLQRRLPVPAPTSTKDTDGLHMYQALGTGWNLQAGLNASAIIHSDDVPAAWRKYGKWHDCQYLGTASGPEYPVSEPIAEDTVKEDERVSR